MRIIDFSRTSHLVISGALVLFLASFSSLEGFVAGIGSSEQVIITNGGEKGGFQFTWTDSSDVQSSIDHITGTYSPSNAVPNADDNVWSWQISVHFNHVLALTTNAADIMGEALPGHSAISVAPNMIVSGYTLVEKLGSDETFRNALLKIGMPESAIGELDEHLSSVSAKTERWSLVVETNKPSSQGQVVSLTAVPRVQLDSNRVAAL
jgi:hypothetical protein